MLCSEALKRTFMKFSSDGHLGRKGTDPEVRLRREVISSLGACGQAFARRRKFKAASGEQLTLLT